MKVPSKPSKVSVVKIHSRKLQVLATDEKPNEVEHSIVWVKPVEGDTPELVASYADKLRKLGAVVVKTLPLQNTTSAVAKSDVDDASTNYNVIEVVEDLLSKCTDGLKDRVSQIVRGAVSRAGL